MSNISMVEAKLPPGFRFHPRDEELVCDYLMKKITHCDSPLMIDVDLNKCEPWDIPETACVGGKEWYFYTHRDRKYATGLRTNRATASGYWKATGKDRAILRKGTLVGMRKTLVFYQGRAPKGKKTDWVMHEFRLEPPLIPPPKISFSKEDWVLCRVFYKNTEEIGKASMGNCYDDTGSSSLPELMDSYISFDQPAAHYDQYEQVPCFSTLFSPHHHQNQTNPNTTNNNDNNTTFMDQPNLGAPKNNINAATSSRYEGGGGTVVPNHLGSSNCLDPFSCDRKVLKAVLTQLTKMETEKGSSPSFADQGSHQRPETNYLSQVAIPNLWNNY